MTASDVSIPAPGGPLPGHLATPTGSGPWPGVVVLHDLVGMSSDLREQADWLAGAGYLAVAPDLFRGNRRPTCMIRMMRETWRRRGPTFADIEATGRWLAERPACTGRVGVIGFCLGGGFALLLAAEHRFDAASVNYGPVSKKVYSEEVLTGACPVVGSYGAKDPGNRGAGDRLSRILAAVGVDHDVKTYPDAGHSFLNDHDPADLPALFAVQFRLTGNPYHDPSAQDARRRILDFFGRHLAQ
ncbi:dienelactone hydrolase family protein [Geodermatophilus sp. CPCC 206100]|uniref:dienelactone hydrolase family protein n=1 Tax=Geodermatophilus sp. CPCC 206100 TaxID=3020054 RepID=UPI003B00A84F